MLKMKSIISSNVNGREYELFFQPDSPINDILEANCQINAFVLGKKEQAKQAPQPINPPETTPENTPEMPPSDLPVTDEATQG